LDFSWLFAIEYCFFLNFACTIHYRSYFLRFYADSYRKVSENDKNAAKSNNFWNFMLDIVEKVLPLQRI
jgi:hypothetical protein